MTIEDIKLQYRIIQYDHNKMYEIQKVFDDGEWINIHKDSTLVGAKNMLDKICERRYEESLQNESGYKVIE